MSDAQVSRAVLPIPDVPHVELTTYDAKIRIPVIPRSGTSVHPRVHLMCSSS
jgi:hypothetical protein